MSLAILLAIVFALGWVPIFYFRAEAISEAFPSYRGSERVWTVAAPAVVSLHVAASCFFLSTLASLPWTRALASSALFAGGIAFWFWARQAISPWRVRRLPDEAPSRLRRDGAFGLVRNPLYFAMLLTAAAPAVAAGEPMLAMTYAAALLCLIVRSMQEERRLHEQLGAEYADYSRTVKRLVPFVW